MKTHSEHNADASLRDKIIGLGERSIRKSYYPQLKKQLTEMEAVQRKLDKSRERYRSLVENINDVIFSLNREGIILYVSPIIETLAGYKPEEVVGKSFKTFIHQEDIEAVVENFESVIGGTIEPKRFRLIASDGSVRHVRSSSRPLTENGEVVGLTGILSDITERIEAQKEREANAERLQNFLMQTIEAIAAMVEARDPYTAGHEQRVAHLASAIAASMGFSDEMVQGVALAASIHDLGKLRVPAEILSKPGLLNEIEYELIKVHPQAGFDIIKSIEFPQPIAQMVLQHHERLDGSGYPQGLKGDEILPGARILAVADVVEAMSSHRPYRPGMGIDAALEEISKHRGVSYDPDVVEHCIALFREGGFAFPV